MEHDNINTVFIGGIPWDFDDRDLRDEFSEFGEVDKATVCFGVGGLCLHSRKVVCERDTGRSRGFGFVTFASRRACDRAIDELDQRVHHFLACCLKLS